MLGTDVDVHMRPALPLRASMSQASRDGRRCRHYGFGRGPSLPSPWSAAGGSMPPFRLAIQEVQAQCRSAVLPMSSSTAGTFASMIWSHLSRQSGSSSRRRKDVSALEPEHQLLRAMLRHMRSDEAASGHRSGRQHRAGATDPAHASRRPLSNSRSRFGEATGRALKASGRALEATAQDYSDELQRIVWRGHDVVSTTQ